MNDLHQLKQATEAAYQAEQAKLRDVLRQEADLRHALVDLDEKRRAARALPADQWAAPRAIGADMLWQGWTQRSRQDLNVQLAQVLVSKAEKMAALTQTFGRAEVVSALLEQQKAARRKSALGRDQRAVEDLALLRSYKS
ncbi:hypothetical protein [Roseovarius sp. M141]|uniref:hypothetical protein n=1 Tax=Roseovarius sp. M141 TaxID=2583806 RepID=UPI0020CC61CE|nr:hypothetical protein [Roseovarius sp. M141]MCQ0091828.1 hypothetical protein [Roseovarius sp. M141]